MRPGDPLRRSRRHRFDDPALGIDWPVQGEPLLSDKDAAAPLLSEIETGF